MQTTIGYVRVSSKGQADNGLSMEAQAEAIKAYCQIYGLELVEIIEDRGLSAKTVKNRPGMLALLERVRERKADAVVVYKLDRMFRSLRDALAVLDEMKARGVAFHSIMEKWDTSTAMGEFAMTMVMAVAQLERKQIGERTKFALRSSKVVTSEATPILASRKKSGKLLVGKAPYGYKWRNKTLVVHREEMLVVRKILDLSTEGKGLKKICAALLAEKIRNRAGDYFVPTQISRILKADYYDEPAEMDQAAERSA